MSDDPLDAKLRSDAIPRLRAAAVLLASEPEVRGEGALVDADQPRRRAVSLSAATVPSVVDETLTPAAVKAAPGTSYKPLKDAG